MLKLMGLTIILLFSMIYAPKFYEWFNDLDEKYRKIIIFSTLLIAGLIMGWKGLTR